MTFSTAIPDMRLARQDAKHAGKGVCVQSASHAVSVTSDAPSEMLPYPADA